ncbi:competence protein CoiA family protein [Segatella bryantii]|uniref:competence protein CoiA family protein n=1 Tax=Segatella bryantii TaxID=77095 RepID=UPI00115FEA1E
MHIRSIAKENKRNHTYRCLQYHKTLIAKIGNKKVPHFAHKKGNACNEKSYLHKLAKRRIREKIIPNSIFELNLLRSGIDIWDNNSLDSYQTGLVYLVKKCINIKNCILCKFYKYNEKYKNHICILYKKLGETYHFPQTNLRNKLFSV